MRVGLFIIGEMVESAEPLQRAFLRVGARSIIHHQIATAQTLNCQRLICLVTSVSPEIAALQHEMERAGASLTIVSSVEDLQGLVDKTDDLLIFTDGLMATPDAISQMLDDRSCVLVMPIDEGLAAGFERVDLNFASAGAMRVPGLLIGRLNDLPPDYDLFSALLRISLQAGVPMQEIPSDLYRKPDWSLVRNDREAQSVESNRVESIISEKSAAMPSELGALKIVQNFGAFLLHAGTDSRLLGLGVTVILLLAVGSHWLELPALGLAVVALGWLGREVIRIMQQVEAKLRSKAALPVLITSIMGWMIDAIIVFLVVPPAQTFGGGVLSRVFTPLILVLLIRLVPVLLDRSWARWMEDRALIATGLALATVMGQAELVMECFALLIVVIALALSSRRPSQLQ